MEKTSLSKVGVRGWTEMKLFDANGKQKKLFQVNKLWQFLNKKFKIDVVIPFVTGHWSFDGIKMNTITTKGKEVIAKQLGGTTTAPVTAVAIGIGTGGTTALNSEITTNGGERGAATVTNVTVGTSGDAEQWVKLFNFTGAFAITEEGLLDNNTSGGNMLAYQSFSAINVASGDSLQITHKVQFS